MLDYLLDFLVIPGWIIVGINLHRWWRLRQEPASPVPDLNPAPVEESSAEALLAGKHAQVLHLLSQLRDRDAVERRLESAISRMRDERDAVEVKLRAAHQRERHLEASLERLRAQRGVK